LQSQGARTGSNGWHLKAGREGGRARTGDAELGRTVHLQVHEVAAKGAAGVNAEEGAACRTASNGRAELNERGGSRGSGQASGLERSTGSRVSGKGPRGRTRSHTTGRVHRASASHRQAGGTVHQEVKQVGRQSRWTVHR